MIYVDVEILAQEFEIGEGEDGEDEDGENANEDGHEILIVTYQIDVFCHVEVWGDDEGEDEEDEQY